MKKRLLSLALVTAVMMAMMPVSILADGVSVMEDPKPYAYSNAKYVEDDLIIGGTEYDEGLLFDMGYTGLSNGGTSVVSYNLDGNFTSMSFYAGYSKGDERNAKLTIIADGVVLVDEDTYDCTSIARQVTIPVTSVKLSKTSVTIGKGKSVTVKATINPSNATTKTVTWSTSNKKIATVKNGKITAKAVGTTYITAKCGGKTAKVKVTVKNLPTKVKLNKSTATLKKGKSLTLKAVVTPTKNAITTLTWSSSNKNIATVKNGKVTAKKTGTVTITVKTVNGKKATCKIKVTK